MSQNKKQGSDLKKESNLLKLKTYEIQSEVWLDNDLSLFGELEYSTK